LLCQTLHQHVTFDSFEVFVVHQSTTIMIIAENLKNWRW